MQPFAPRPITFLGVLEHGGWRLKHYGIVFGGATLGRAAFAACFGRDAYVHTMMDGGGGAAEAYLARRQVMGT